jgi:hypothetical protein
MLKGKIHHRVKVDPIVIPTTLMYQNTPYKITKVHPNYHIKEYCVVVNNFDDNIVLDIVLLNCFHPNVIGGEKKGFVDINKPPKESKYCMPDYIINRWKFCEDPDYIKVPGDNILSMKDFNDSFLKIWAMDNPHHYPSKKLVSAEYKHFANGKWVIDQFPHFN